jgi:cellulose synthase/poly-beta-1,6-N-acetylglucosamine synthase-like glycosyltransferase
VIACLIPAHNEQDTIAATLDSVLAQTRRVDRVVVVADNCTDRTAVVARHFRLRDVAVDVAELAANRDRKAGALNHGYKFIADYDFVLTMDADTILEPEFVEKTVADLEANPRLGGVCARYWAKFERNQFPPMVQNFQRLEYARFDDSRMLRDWRVSVLSGAAVMYRGAALRQVCEWRETTC